MSKLIENPKTYSGHELETIFFRPMLTGPSAMDLGIKVMYNMPMPTTLNFWRRSGDILQPYGAGWNGSKAADRYQKSIDMSKVKAEIAYSASDYFSMVFELITNRADVNLDDLSGTELEAAETELFRQAIAESIRATMWLGNTERENGMLGTFNGLLKAIHNDRNEMTYSTYTEDELMAEGYAEQLLRQVLADAPEELRALKSEGQLAFFCSSDIYAAYENSLDSVVLDAAYEAKQNGRVGLSMRGIPVIDLQLGKYSEQVNDLPSSFVILTDRRNLALAVNTSDFPGTEIRMWYNPDQMENRQRAVFMAGCDYLLPELVSYAHIE
ncbi:MAG: hypothetical protein IJX68_03205 [Rikenellaceae bacterium]|nr:hypothetical protein [Rikenellaceae bacterium]